MLNMAPLILPASEISQLEISVAVQVLVTIRVSPEMILIERLTTHYWTMLDAQRPLQFDVQVMYDQSLAVMQALCPRSMHILCPEAFQRKQYQGLVIGSQEASASSTERLSRRMH